MIKSFNEYFSYKEISPDEIKDILYEVESEYEILKLEKIRFNPKKRFSIGRLSFLIDWCHDKTWWAMPTIPESIIRTHTGRGFKLSILKKGEDKILGFDGKKDLRLFIKKVNKKRLNYYGLGIDIFESEHSLFIMIYYLNSVKPFGNSN